MKPSEAMLKGFEMAGGRQYRGGWFYDGPNSKAPCGVCAMGAIRLGFSGDALGGYPDMTGQATLMFHESAGILVTEANDHLGMSIPEIAAILAEHGF